VGESASITFKKRLLELRQTMRWTQKKAAQASKINHCLYQFYELGIKKNPGLLTLEKIAKGFGIEVYELLSPAPARFRKRSDAPTPKRKHGKRRIQNKRR
jgi:transcriptional regulator with XRE-family HTH domain